MSYESENLVQEIEETLEENTEAVEQTDEEMPQDVPKKRKKLIKRKYKSIKKAPIILYLTLAVFGVILCIMSWGVEFNLFGNINSPYLGIPGGIITMGAIAIELWGIKCPYCGSHKVGRVIGFKLKYDKKVECPDCHKHILIK